MRPTLVRHGDMPGPKVYSQWWGDKSHSVNQKYITSYTVSPFRQRALKGAFSHYLLNGTRRLAEQAPYWVIPFGIAYGAYVWGKNKYAWQNTKAGHQAMAAHGEEH